MTLDLSKEITTAHGGPPKILVIDDNKEFCDLLATHLRVIKCHPVITTDPNEVISILVEAEKHGEPFSAATIDMRYDVTLGNESLELLQGTRIVEEIKAHCPYVGCLMITGETIFPQEMLLDWRDNFGLDYWLSKDKLDMTKVAVGIKRAFDHANGNTPAQRKQVSAQANVPANLMTRKPSTRHDIVVDKQKLRRVLVGYFNEQELREVCFDFGINYGELSGTSIREKALELLTYLDRRNRLTELDKICRELRPHAFAAE